MGLDLSKITKLINIDFSSILNVLKSVLGILVILIALFIFYKVIRFIMNRIRESRIRNTYKNTGKILEKLNMLEAKIDFLSNKIQIPKTKEEKGKRNIRKVRRIKKSLEKSK